MIKKIAVLCMSLALMPSISYADPIFKGIIGQKPLSVAVDFLQGKLPSGDDEGKQITTLTQERIYCKPDKPCPLRVKIVMTIDGISDDSIQAQRYTVILKQDKEVWEVIDTMLDQSCHKGRGHTDFSNQSCQ